MAMTVGVRLAALSDVGRVRDHNEDRHLAWEQPASEPSPLGVRAVLAVADGMGGHAGGEVASELAISALRAVLASSTDRPELTRAEEMADYLRNTVAWINQQVAALGESKEGRKPGTTLTALVVHREQFVLAHVGDSRAYRLRRGAIELLTDDHSFVGEQVRAGKLSPEMARTSPFRGQLTRAIGNAETVEVDLKIGDVEPGDRFLVCSDGLNEYLRDSEIAAVIQNAAGLSAACQRLLETALARGGGDNVTAVLGQIGEAEGPSGNRSPSAQTLPGLPATLLGAAAPTAADATPARASGGATSASNAPTLAWSTPVELHHARHGSPLGSRGLLLGAVVVAVLLAGFGFLLARGLRQPRPEPSPAPILTEPTVTTTSPATPPPAPVPVPQKATLTVSTDGNDVILTPTEVAGLDWTLTAAPDYQDRVTKQGQAWRIELNSSAKEQRHQFFSDGKATGEPAYSRTREPWLLALGEHELRFSGTPIATVTLQREKPAGEAP